MEAGPRSRPPPVCASPGVSRAPVRLQPARRLLRRAHHSPTEPEESQQRYKDPLPGGARSAVTRYGAPAPCRVAAPRTAGLRGRATLPQLDWGRPSRVRTSARTRCAHPGKANTASETHGSASSVLGTDTAGIPYPRVLSLLGLLWRCTPAHRLTLHPWTWTGTSERRSYRTNNTAAQGPRRRMRRFLNMVASRQSCPVQTHRQVCG